MTTEAKLTNQIKKYQWANRLEKINNENYIIWCDYYPYSEDTIVLKLRKMYNVNLTLKSIGNR